MQTAEPWDADADAENADADSDAVAVDDAVAKVDAVAEDDDDLKVIFAWRGHRTVRVSDRKGTIRSGEWPLKMRRMTISNIIIDQKEWRSALWPTKVTTTQNGDDDNQQD